MGPGLARGAPVLVVAERLAGARLGAVPVALAAAALSVCAALPTAAAASSVHLPDNKRWAASATASAISMPSFEALVIAAVAALVALSAASSPASRILRRAVGEAAIAAAAAVSPAASISRLIAALVIFSKVESVPLVLPPERVLVVLAMHASREQVADKTVHPRNGSVKRAARQNGKK